MPAKKSQQNSWKSVTKKYLYYALYALCLATLIGLATFMSASIQKPKQERTSLDEFFVRVYQRMLGIDEASMMASDEKKQASEYLPLECKNFHGQQKVIPTAWVNDDYCDCPLAALNNNQETGSIVDETRTSACSYNVLQRRGGGKYARGGKAPFSEIMARFQCHTARPSGSTIPVSQVNDGVCDCCDGSDEIYKEEVKEKELMMRKAPCPNTCLSEWHAEKKRLQEKVNMVRAGHKKYQSRCHHGAKVWGEAFENNVTDKWKQVQDVKANFEAVKKLLMKATAAGEEVKPDQMETLEEMQRFLKEHLGPVSAMRALYKKKGLGASYELWPLFDLEYPNCLEGVFHEKVFRGGSALPEMHNFTFGICPFKYIIQKQAKDDGDDGGKVVGVGETEEGETSKNEEEEAPTLLGSWSKFMTLTNLSLIGEGFGTKYSDVSFYENGAPCWEGPVEGRTAKVVLSCYHEDQLLKAFENGKCRYELEVGTPSKCTAEVLHDVEEKLRKVNENLVQF